MNRMTLAFTSSGINDSVFDAVNASNYTGIEREPTWLTAITGVVLAVCITLAIFGNILVVCAVAYFPRLRTPTNALLVSLATADLTVAMFVMIPSVIYDVMGVWIFGWIFCLFWLSADIMCCTASILHLCVVSLDRYWAITKPFEYANKMSKKRVVFLIALVWFCSITISFVPVYSGWYTKNVEQIYVDSPVCTLEVNKVFAVVSSCTSFYIPLFIMVFAYYKIFIIARTQAKRIAELEASIRPLTNAGNDLQSHSRKFNNDRKAIKTLGIIMGIFIICWMPFFLMYLILPYCDNCPKLGRWERIITWIGYVNSFMNPFIYAFLNKDFRMAFNALLRGYCCRSVDRRSLSETFYLNDIRNDIRDFNLLHRRPSSATQNSINTPNSNKNLAGAARKTTDAVSPTTDP